MHLLVECSRTLSDDIEYGDGTTGAGFELTCSFEAMSSMLFSETPPYLWRPISGHFSRGWHILRIKQ